MGLWKVVTKTVSYSPAYQRLWEGKAVSIGSISSGMIVESF